ncbi:MAG: hypothetical protein KDD44_06440 [Bdellovibrionales bacterium]|nr:hypothetical protein [Bdellovibrionales bacterium]
MSAAEEQTPCQRCGTPTPLGVSYCDPCLKILQETYLGDGLYARYDGFGIWLRAPRLEGDHLVYLEAGSTLEAFTQFVKDIAELVKIGSEL